ncbi:hypothetical protein CR207_05370 [Chromobacterium violaceum]|nr:hypothetical protein CRN81_05355 [Chromobacterium violaceum]ATP31786.1 hypothetical protein CR207_05370 [Chromobacterium violaceum]
MRRRWLDFDKRALQVFQPDAGLDVQGSGFRFHLDARLWLLVLGREFIGGKRCRRQGRAAKRQWQQEGVWAHLDSCVDGPRGAAGVAWMAWLARFAAKTRGWLGQKRRIGAVLNR